MTHIKFKLSITFGRLRVKWHMGFEHGRKQEAEEEERRGRADKKRNEKRNEKKKTKRKKMIEGLQKRQAHH